MLADAVATPVLERLRDGAEAHGTLHVAGAAAAYADLGDVVLALTARGVPLMPNGVSVERIAVGDGAVRVRAGRLEAAGGTVAWDGRARRFEPALRRADAGERDALRARGAAILDALRGADLGIAGGPRGREGVRHLHRALADRDAGAAARAAERLLGLGAGLTPEGDDVLAATAATVVAAGGAAAFGGPARDRFVAALVPAGDLRARTAPLSATLLALAAEGRIAEPVHALVDPADAGWRAALARLTATGASTGCAYALAVGRTLAAL